MKLLLMLLLLGSGLINAQTNGNNNIDALGWLEGHWEGELNGNRIDDIVTDAKNGQMMGMFRFYNDEKIFVNEFYYITESDSGVHMLIRHFDKDLNSWEKGDPIIMKLISSDNNKYVFENFIHNNPKRNTLTKISDNEYTAFVEIIKDDGSLRTMNISLKKPN